MTATTMQGARSRWVVLALAAATAGIHISRALVDPDISMLFWLNAIGYVVLGLAYALPIPALEAWRSKIRWALIAYTATTIVLFFVWGAMSGDWPVIGFVDKAIEIALIAVLWLDRRA
jgi:hypothetical protein